MKRPSSPWLQCFFIDVLVALGLILAVPMPASASKGEPIHVAAVNFKTITGNAGSQLQTIHIGEEMSFQVFHRSIPGSGQFYPTGLNSPADMGVFAVVGATLFAPDFANHGGSATASIGPHTVWTPVSFSALSGDGSSATPWTYTVVANAGATGLRLSMLVTYRDADNYFRHDFTFSNTSASAMTFTAYLGSDIYLADSDAGIPVRVGNSVGGKDCGTGNYQVLHIPFVPPDHYTAKTYSQVWQQIGTHGNLDDVVATGCIDDGAALQWTRTLQPGASVTIPAATSFGEIPAGVCENCCGNAPLNMTAWWPLDEQGDVAVEIVAGLNGQHSKCFPWSGKVRGSRLYQPLHSGTKVPDDARLDIDAGDFTVDAWFSSTSSRTILPIVDKRQLAQELGYALYVKNGKLEMRLANALGTTMTTTATSASCPTLLDGQWHHVAATLTRGNSATVSLYVDGCLGGTGTGAFPTNSTLANSAPLLIGVEAPFAPENINWLGNLDEIELFDRALAPNEIQTLYDLGQFGKCKELLHVPQAWSKCQGASTVDVTIEVCNHSVTAHTYDLAFVGVWPNGPTAFQIVSPTPPVSVPAGTCQPVTVRITLPAGLSPGAASQYQVSATNLETGRVFGSTGTVREAFRMCAGPRGGMIGMRSVASGDSTLVDFGIRNTSGQPLDFSCEIAVANVTPHANDAVAFVRLNGLPPGTPVAAVVHLAPSESTTVSARASFTRFTPLRIYDVVLRLDADGDGMMEPVTSVGVRSVNPAAKPPSVSGAFPVANDTLRVEFDRAVTAASAQNAGNYALASFATVSSAMLVSNGTAVHLALFDAPPPGTPESITVNGIVAADNALAMPAPVSLEFVSGVLPISMVQAPDSDSLGAVPCLDRSRFAGSGYVPGPRITLRGVCVASAGGESVLEDAAGGPRSGVVCTNSKVPLNVGHRYLWSGYPAEMAAETQAGFNVYLRDEGVVAAPIPALRTLHELRDTGCDATQSVVNGEDYEGVLVSAHQVKVAAFATPPRQPLPGGSFLVTGPLGVYSDTLRVVPATGTFAADTFQVLDVSGVLRFQSGRFVLVPRGDADIHVQGVLGAADAMSELSFTVYPNPTRWPAAIRLALPQASRVELSVFDVSGRRMARLADGPFAAGTHEIKWSGRDSRGSIARPGMYFFRLRGGGVTRMVRVVKIE